MTKSMIVRRIHKRIKEIGVEYRRLLRREKRFEKRGDFKTQYELVYQMRELRDEQEECEIALDVIGEVSNPARGGQTRRRT